MGNDRLVTETEKVAEIANGLGIQLLIIGAAALAGHRYIRATQDIDLAGNISVTQFHQLADALSENGYATELHLPDQQDPLAGVLNVTCPAGLIQIISYHDRFPAVIEDALNIADLRFSDSSSICIIPLSHLVVLKLYAGGLKSKLDIIEVLKRNPQVDLNDIALQCERYQVSGFGELRGEVENLR